MYGAVKPIIIWSKPSNAVISHDKMISR